MPWVRVTPDPNDPTKMVQVPAASPFSPSNILDWLRGKKIYILSGVAIAKIIYTAVYGHPWSDQADQAINWTLALLGIAAARSALNTSVAQVANALVNPTSQAAKKLAAKAPGAPPVQ